MNNQAWLYSDPLADFEAVMLDRQLDWDGCFNVRDMGGLPTISGARTRPGAAVRADSLNKLTDHGWAALLDHGVRTVIDLRNDFERAAEPDQAAINAAFLAERETSAAQLIGELLDQQDLNQTLRGGGLTDADLSALRARLLDQ